VDKVDLSKVEKELRKLPEFIVIKLQSWAARVELYGLEEVRKIPGFHDELLKGNRTGQRSIRLNKSYRAIYEVRSSGQLRIISIEEVNKHEY
jgi:toxin HigB-1